MNNYAQLFRDLFRKTNGFMLNWPLGKTIRVGDFFTLRAGKISVVGNIYESYFQLSISDTFSKDLHRFEAPLLEPYDFDRMGWESFRPPEGMWNIMSGCYTNYQSKHLTKPHKKKLLPAEVNIYDTQFPLPGGYFFASSHPHYCRMPHFKEIHKELIRRLTTEFYNFHRIYLVTDVAAVKDFSVGVSAIENAVIQVSRPDYYNGNLIDLVNSEETFDVEKVFGMETLKLKHEGGGIAFRAKKMGLSIKAKDTLIREIFATKDRDIEKYAVELIDNELFHLFPKIEINPSNANEFFEWTDMSLEDIEYFLGGSLA
ncbi:hypothetical protein [Roseivirga thermotolerans]|uniref:hypothetical protein n=1 Tax=Roseivirga thermotolerans TaxID=1758176 RepID=UPI00273F7217|nr:hypothetical protein [Roseivirga thermotolerans]